MENPNKVWEPAKQFMIDDIKQLDKNANVTIVLFHQSTATPICFKAKAFKQNNVVNQCNEMFAQSTRTGICNAWDLGLKYIDNTRNNYLYLFTDGTENVHPQKTSAVCKRIREWCQQAPNNYAFFVALGNELKNKPEVRQLMDATRSCDRAFFIEDHQGPFGAFDKTNYSMNSHAIKKVYANFSDCGTFNAQVECNDPYYSISLDGNKITNGKAVFIIKQKQQPNKNHQVHFRVKSNPQKMHICNPDMFINIDTRNLANLDFAQPSGINEGQYDAGVLETYSSFLFCKGKVKDTGIVNLGAVFNDQAKKRNCTMDVIAKLPNSLKGKCKLYYNSQPIGSKFSIRHSDAKSILTVEVQHALPEKDFVIELQGKSNNLESINSELGRKYVSSVYLEHTTCWNPLKTILFWLSIVIIALLILWFTLLRWIFYPRIRLSRIQMVCEKENYYENKKINSARKVIVSSQKGKQNWLNKLFTGKIVYIASPVWTSQWEMTPKDRKRVVRINLHGKYLVSPITSEFQNMGEYTITNKETNNKILIQIL